MDKEIWRDIPGFFGKYQFSNRDRVRITDHIDGAGRFRPGRIKSPHVSRKVISYEFQMDGVKSYFNLNELRNMIFPENIVVESGWKPVIGFEKYYEVNEEGIVRSKEYEEIVNGKHIHRYPKILKQHFNEDGYLCVKLRDNKQHRVHQIVAEAFLEKLDDSHEVDHIDADRTNNHVSNLRFVTHQENIIHCIELGNRLVGNTRSKNYNAKPVEIIDDNNVAKRFECLMDACEYIKNIKCLKSSLSSMMSGIRKAFLNNKCYFGFSLRYL